MGRLDEQAKKRIIELRKAGLSFRKIKTVLEVDNIKVTAQAVYLFLKRKKVNPVRESGPPHPERHVTPLTGVARANGNPAWENQQLWNLMHENSAARQTAGRAGEQGTGPQPQQGMVGALESPKDTKGGIRIVSVTSLSNGGGQFQVEKNLTNSVAENLPCSKSECVASPPSAPMVSGCALSSVSPLNTQQQQPKQPGQANSEGKGYNMVPKNTILLTRKKLLEKAILLKRRQVSVQNSPAVSTPPAVQRFPMSNQTGRQPISAVQRNSPTMTTVANTLVPATSAANSHLIANSSVPQQVVRDGQTVNMGRSAPSLLIAGSRPSIGSMGKDANGQPVLVTTNTSAPVQNFLHTNSQMSGSTAAGSSQFTVPAPAISMSSLVEKLDTVYTEVQNLAKAFQSVVDRQSRLEQQQEQQHRTQQDILAALQQLNFTLNASQAPLTQNCMSYNTPNDAPPPTQQFGQYKMELF